MITLLQESLRDPNTFITTDNLETATHYKENGEFMGEITAEVRALVENDDENTPLEMPAMNFGKDAKKDVKVVNVAASNSDNSSENPLVMPEINFSKSKKDKLVKNGLEFTKGGSFDMPFFADEEEEFIDNEEEIALEMPTIRF